jgi:hypothetical protein
MNDNSNRMAPRGPNGRPGFDAQDDGPFVPEDIVAWVHEQIARACPLLVLRQRMDEGGEMVVCNMTLPGDGPQAIAASLYSRAMSEGRYLRGPTLFMMYAFKEVGREHCDRKSFRVEGESYARTGETEPPTMAGINSMLMRHTDAATKIALGHTSHIIEQYKVLLLQRDRRISELEASLREASAVRESLVMFEHERALSMHRVNEDSKRSDFMRDKLDLLIPVVASKMLGTTSMGVPPVVNDEILKQLLGSLSNEQLFKLQGILNPDQQTAVGDLYTRYAQRSKDPEVAAAGNAAAEARNAAAAANAGAVNGHANGASHAAPNGMGDGTAQER